MKGRKTASLLRNPDQIREISKAVSEKMVARSEEQAGLKPVAETRPLPQPEPEAQEDREQAVIIRIGKSYHRLAKVAAAQAGITLRDYLEAIIANDAGE